MKSLLSIIYRAIGLKEKLSGLGFKCEIQMAIINNRGVYHRVHVGPFAELVMLDNSRRKLDELGVESRTVLNRK